MQPPGHNLWDHFVPSLYAYRTKEEMVTLGPMNVSEACYWLHPSRCNYSYPEYTNEQYDDYYGYYDDVNERLPTVHPTHTPTITGEGSPTTEPTVSKAPVRITPSPSVPPIPPALIMTIGISVGVVTAVVLIIGGLVYWFFFSGAAATATASASSTAAASTAASTTAYQPIPGDDPGVD